jgi:hypothetical protein
MAAVTKSLTFISTFRIRLLNEHSCTFDMLGMRSFALEGRLASLMKHILLSLGAVVGIAVSAAYSQTSTAVNLNSQSRNPDFSNFAFTRPVSVGTTLPSTCQVGQLFFNSSAAAGANIFACTQPNAWSVMGANTLQPAGSGTLGGVMIPTNSGLTLGSNGALSANVGTLAGTVAAGNDSRIVNALQPTSSIPASNITGLARSATTDTTNASNITTGTLTPSLLPNPTSSTLGGVKSFTAPSHQWINSVSTGGALASTQPAFTDISGSLAASQTPAMTGDTTSPAGSTVTTTVRVNGVTYPAAPAPNTIPVITGANAATYEQVPNAALANNSITLTGTPNQIQISGGGPLALGGSATLSLPSSVTLGSAGSSSGSLVLSGATSGTTSIHSSAAAGNWSMTLPSSSGAAGQFLQTDGSGNTSWVTASGAITGLTANALPRATSSSALGNSSITDNGTTVSVSEPVAISSGSTNAIGIGTTNPGAALDINSNSLIIEIAQTPASSSASCTTGTIAWDTNYVYVCVAANSWRRSALATF